MSNYYLKLLFNPTDLTFLANRNDFQTAGKVSIREKPATYSFSNELIQRIGYQPSEKIVEGKDP